MKTVTAKPDLIEALTTWAHANPFDAFMGMVILWVGFCFYNAVKHSF